MERHRPGVARGGGSPCSCAGFLYGYFRRVNPAHLAGSYADRHPDAEPLVAVRVVQRRHALDDGRRSALSVREREVVQRVALGETSPEIADELGIAHEFGHGF